MGSFSSLNRNTDFRRVYWRGKSYSNPALVVYVLKGRAGICRVGITTGKKIGNAVERNRSRRVIRAAFDHLSSRISGCWDIVLVARSKTKYLKSSEIEKIMHDQFVSAGVIPG